jgi:hypothetical protein
MKGSEQMLYMMSVVDGFSNNGAQLNRITGQANVFACAYMNVYICQWTYLVMVVLSTGIIIQTVQVTAAC